MLTFLTTEWRRRPGSAAKDNCVFERRRVLTFHSPSTVRAAGWCIFGEARGAALAGRSTSAVSAAELGNSFRLRRMNLPARFVGIGRLAQEDGVEHVVIPANIAFRYPVRAKKRNLLYLARWLQIQIAVVVRRIGVELFTTLRHHASAGDAQFCRLRRWRRPPSSQRR